MYPLTHFLVSFFIGLVLVKQGYFSMLQALYTGLVGLLIDIDHFVYFVIKKKSFNFKDAWNSAIKHTLDERTSLVHLLPGFLIFSFLILVLFFISKIWFWIFFIGYYSHMVLDFLNFKKWLEVNKRFRFKEEGFLFNVPLYEIVFICILVILILVTLFYY